MNLAWMYEGFFLRDLLAFVVPGAIVLGAAALGADPELWKSIADWHWLAALLFGAPVAYTVGLCLYHLATLLRLSASDHTKAFLVDPERATGTASTASPASAIATFFQYPSHNQYETTLVNHYEQMANRDSVAHLRAQLTRHSVLKQACGQLGAALLVLFVAALLWSRSDAMNNPNELLRIAMHRSFKLLCLSSAALLLVAHVRHARFQALMARAFAARLATDSKAGAPVR